LNVLGTLRRRFAGTELALGLDYPLLSDRHALASSLREAGAPFVASAKVAKYG